MQMTLKQAIDYLQPIADSAQLAGYSAALAMALDALREKQERENPKPLTLDELRGMMGEPVWCVSESGASWFIVNKGLLSIVNGVTAYRHKPGEVDE